MIWRLTSVLTFRNQGGILTSMDWESPIGEGLGRDSKAFRLLVLDHWSNRPNKPCRYRNRGPFNGPESQWRDGPESGEGDAAIDIGAGPINLISVQKKQ